MFTAPTRASCVFARQEPALINVNKNSKQPPHIFGLTRFPLQIKCFALVDLGQLGQHYQWIDAALFCNNRLFLFYQLNLLLSTEPSRESLCLSA